MRLDGSSLFSRVGVLALGLVLVAAPVGCDSGIALDTEHMVAFPAA